MTRILLAGLFHETHCFVNGTTGLGDFNIDRSAALMDFAGNGSTIDGFLDVAARQGWDVEPACTYAASPSAMVEDAVIEAFWSDLEPVARRGPYDAVYLNLHGAMVAESFEDVEGTIMERLRAIDGFAELPIFGVFDLHANMTARMAAHANGLVGYRENPHIDARDSAVRAAELLARCLKEQTVPRMFSRHAGIVWPPTGTGTADTPMRELEALARRIEADNADIWAVNVVAGFSFADMPDAGVAFSLVTTGQEQEARAALDALCAKAWELRAEGLPAEDDPADVLARIAAQAFEGPVILVEPSDNVSGGAPGNGTGVLRALLSAGTQNAGVVIADAEAVIALDSLAPSERRMVAIGGKDNPFDPGPVELDVELVSRSDGNFTLEDIKSHMVAARGKHIEMGPCAVVRHGGVTILLTSLKTPPFDLGQWRSQGINPEELSVIGVKAAVAHRRAYDKIAAASFTVETLGPCISDPRKLPYTRLNRPTYPLDES
ncbi:MAG: M81 family metallopeptidase [Roseitalea sp.]|jgi:microcystin degradation protein MlrC|nr:M81 family metallopeptidase [Roseitalea sp.]MBO6720471.1 M81 family metallopeptidase [Roseitalea sp.]MBO6743618.1 M81 family metallopeptidase [Roseitalea sp.]